MSTNFTQDFFTSRRNYPDGNTRIGELDRLWYDSITKTIRIGDGITPGGEILFRSTSDTVTLIDGGRPYSVYGGVDVIDGGGVNL
jgi:hypothetical protein